ncbi:hypothetical protein [Actinospica sp.]|jgi:hypothetical protein|uniref:hypothetical protein n=1 Tax=Actinospica sp. TaxID=1872142 RepID=UPI002C926C60|nr:hypothetical protein [Actinospica sp.]HWG24366.1 hypothetical protein [Actinospica sp.]
MNTTRRSALGAALAAPLLTRFTGTASADAAPGKLGSISDGWVEVRWTQEAQTQLEKFGAVVEAVAPARLVTDASGPGVRFPVRSGAGDPSLTELPKAQGDGALEGGIVVRTANGSVTLTELSSDLRSELAAGKCLVNGVSAGHDAAVRCGLAEGVLTTESVPPGKPMKVRLADVPLRPTGEALDVYTAVLGAPPITADTVLAHLTAEGVYHPPTA